MSTTKYDIGDRVRVSVPFTDDAGTAADPTAITFKYKKPGDSAVSLVYGTDAELKKLSTGNYYVDLDVDTAGEWWWVRFEGTGDIVAADEDNFWVLESNV